MGTHTHFEEVEELEERFTEAARVHDALDGGRGSAQTTYARLQPAACAMQLPRRARSIGWCVGAQRLRRLCACCCRLRLAQTVVATFSPGGQDACYVLDVQARCFSRGCVRAL